MVILFQQSIQSHTVWGCHLRWVFTDTSSPTYSNGLPDNFNHLKINDRSYLHKKSVFLKVSPPNYIMSSWYDKYRSLTPQRWNTTGLVFLFSSFISAGHRCGCSPTLGVPLHQTEQSKDFPWGELQYERTQGHMRQWTAIKHNAMWAMWRSEWLS